MTGSGLGRRAAVDSARLGASLGLSWILAFGGRLIVPRVLGEDRYGQLSYIESLTLLVMTLLALGADTYIRTEVASRPGHALEFARPLAQLRIIAGTTVAAGFGIAFTLASGSVERGAVALAFGLGQLAVILGQTQASYLHAVQRVRAVSLSAISSKLLWIVLLLSLLGAGVRLLALPIAMLGAEIFRNVWLRRAFRAELGVPLPAPIAAATRVIRASMPFYIDSINLAFTNYSVPIILGIVVDDREVGLLAAATMAITVPMFFAPLLSWVLTPTFSRLHVIDPGLMWRRASDFIEATFVTICIGAAVLIGISTTLMSVLFGDGFAKGGPAFAVLAIGMPATFLSMVLASALVCSGRGWLVTKVNLLTMVGMTAAALVGVLIGRGHGNGAPALGGAIGISLGEWATGVSLWVLCRPSRPSALRLINLGLSGAGAAALLVATTDGAASGWRWTGVGVLLVAGFLEIPGLVRAVRQTLAHADETTDSVI